MEASSISLSGSFHLDLWMMSTLRKTWTGLQWLIQRDSFINLMLPPLALKRVIMAIYSKDSDKKSNMLTVGIYTFLYLVWIALFIAILRSLALCLFGWMCLFANGFILMSIKSTFRDKCYNISRNPIGNFIWGILFYPCVLWQLDEQCQILGLPNQRED